MATPHLNISWSHTDPDPQEVKFRLYENGDMIVDNIASLHFDLLMAEKSHGTYAYSVDAVKYGLASDRSEEVSVNFSPPVVPTNLKTSWIES
jgi:hypothetical protein